MKKAGLMVSVVLLLFFSYGHFYELVANLSIGSFIIGRHRYVLFAYGMLIISGFYLTIRTRASLDNVTGILNVTAGSLVLMSLINIGVYELKTRAVWQDNRKAQTNLINLEKPDRLPNIYYIILDAYARADILKEIYVAKKDIASYASLCEKIGFTPKDCQSIATMYKSKRLFHDALTWKKKDWILKKKEIGLVNPAMD